MLGHRLKYSGSFFGDNLAGGALDGRVGNMHGSVGPLRALLTGGQANSVNARGGAALAADLDGAEDRTLQQYADLLGLKRGVASRVLDMGCGWGSFTLFAAERYPASTFVCASNSPTQGRHIAAEAKARGLANVRHVVVDVNDLSLAALGVDAPMDKAISIEMFEHCSRYDLLFKALRGVLREGAALVVQVFCHDKYAYKFGAGSWMADTFFTDGTMPSFRLLPSYVADDGPIPGTFATEKSIRVNGNHYAQTCWAWLSKLDARHAECVSLFAKANGGAAATGRKWTNAWRMFFMACAELFGYNQGREWYVANYRFRAL